jgi:hypothetical protein
MNTSIYTNDSKERPLSEEAFRRRLRIEDDISLSRSKFRDLVEIHRLPYIENALQCRGGSPNRYYEWTILRPFIIGFVRKVN